MNANSIRRGSVAAIILAAAVAGAWYAGHRAGSAEAPAKTVHADTKAVDAVVQDDSGKRVLYWYDPMTPQQKFDKPGKSPFMDMQLVAKYADEGAGAAVSISSRAEQNLGIRTAVVEKARFGDALSAVGTLRIDERRIAVVQSRVSGFVERLYVRAPGDAVRRGQRIADIYSPELYAAQQEWLALARMRDFADSDRVVRAARERLSLLGMTAADIDRVAASGQAARSVALYTANGGIVQEIAVREGGAVTAGMPLMQLADLSSLWLVADVPERDAQALRPGLAVEARLPAMPARALAGRIDYVVPGLDPATRTVKVRIVVANREGDLAPGMFAQVDIKGPQRESLSVPTEAVIATGVRKVVIVREANGFRPADVRTGAEQSGRTEVLQGVAQGEEIVASGQFLIDSEAALSGVLARLAARPEVAPTQSGSAGARP